MSLCMGLFCDTVFHVNSQQQVTFDLGKLVLAGVLGFVLAMTGNFIFYYAINRDRRLRLLEREGKRHRFWKDFFEIPAALPEPARYTARDIEAATDKCREELSVLTRR